KHLVQAVQPVPPIFFLEVTRNRTAPLWSHPSLIPLDSAIPITSNSADLSSSSRLDVIPYQRPADMSDHSDDDDDIDLVDTAAGSHSGGATFDERLTAHLATIRNFCDGLEDQRQFNDSRILDTLAREGAGFLR
ncbi:hypothetical protein B0H11DRAFT_1665796, partial [Mycena galericulata]